MDLSIKQFTGPETTSVLPQLAELRIKVFKEFPYLYEGDLEYEKKYLQTHVNSKRSLVVAVFDKDQLVGASTALPLSDESVEFTRPFKKANFDIAKIFYFGESIILPSYRGKKLGHQFFELRENHAKSHQAALEYTCFCAVVRPKDHPLRPSSYRPLNEFWQRMGYLEHPNIQVEYKWKDIDQTQEDFKTLNVWLKKH